MAAASVQNKGFCLANVAVGLGSGTGDPQHLAPQCEVVHFCHEQSHETVIHCGGHRPARIQHW